MQEKKKSICIHFSVYSNFINRWTRVGICDEMADSEWSAGQQRMVMLPAGLLRSWREDG